MAPVLIFLMISSLVNFLILLFYGGTYVQRVPWILLMYTMGSVAVARLAIEQTRAYALGYAAVLGFVTLFVMTGFVGAFVFTLMLLLVISVLADRLVHDCTLIDDSLDASGQGLVDFGRTLLRSHTGRSTGEPEQPVAHQPPRRRTHQPGRTVMWLALAALPLFGLGQFMLHSDPDTWSRAKWLLAVYLFTSLSLLVTTSFLGLRRYLRQRGAEMPTDVSVAWIAGGLFLILLILFGAYLAPVPGQLLASIEVPDFLSAKDDQRSSRFGWGDEGAERNSADDPMADQPSADPDAPPSGQTQEGAQPGSAEGGDAKQAPAGNEKGGKQPAAGEPSPNAPPGPEPSQSSGEPSQSSQEPGEGDAGLAPPSDPAADPSQGDGPKPSDAAEPNTDQPAADPAQPSDSPPDRAEPQTETESTPDASETTAPNDRASDPPGSSSSNLLPQLSSLLRWMLMLALFGIVAVFGWLNREALLQWWRSLFAGPEREVNPAIASSPMTLADEPLRPFASFVNPVDRETDPRRTIVITFQAFEAWSRERGWKRSKDETPSEFLRRVTRLMPQASVPAQQVVDAYNRIVYGRGNATRADLHAASTIWNMMTGSEGK